MCNLVKKLAQSETILEYRVLLQSSDRRYSISMIHDSLNNNNTSFVHWYTLCMLG